MTENTQKENEVVESVDLDKLPVENSSPTMEQEVAAEKQKAATKAAKIKATKKAKADEIAQKKAEAEASQRIATMAAEIAAKAVKEAQEGFVTQLESMKSQIDVLTAKNKKLADSNKQLEDGLLETDVEALEKEATAILTKAAKINAEFSALTSNEERADFIEALETQLGVKGFISQHFTIPALSESDDVADPIPVADDLPLSQIIVNLPVRIVEQKLVNTLQGYELARFITVTNVRNGLAQIFYGDYNPSDNKAAYTDVTIDDFNGKTTPAGTENFQVDTNIHVQYKILDSALNDVTVSMGLFLSIVSSSVNGFVKPVALKMYQRFVSWLDKVDSYDEIIDFPAASDIKAKAKILAKKVFSLKTTSRKHLKKIPQGLTQALEYKINMSNTTIIMNADYAVDYKFDLTAMTFQLGEITYKVKDIIVLDLDLVKDYVEATTGTLESLEVILLEDGVYQEIRHYTGSKLVNTAKLFSIFHWYTRIKNFRRKDKIAIGFKTAV